MLSSLREAYATKTREATERWSAFEAERKRLVESGADLQKDTAAVKRLDDLHQAYKAVAEEAGDLQERMLRAIDGKATSLPGAARDGLASVGSEFLKRLGVSGVGLKALDGTSGGSLVPPFFDPRIRDLPQRGLFVRSLIPVRQADSDKVWYLRQSVADQQAAPVAAGALKPTSVYTVERIEEPIVTIAHVTEALDRALLSDFDQLVSFIDGQLRLGVLLAEEDQILNGDGIGVHFTGVLNTAGILTQATGADPQADAIHKAITKVRGYFYEPDGIVLHPNDWETIRLSKDGEGDYYAAPIIEVGPTRLWGLRVITSPVIAEGTGLVGAFASGASLWDREEARVTFTESGLGDNAGEELFTRNQIRFRAEERLAFGVERPQAFCEVTGL